MQDSGLCLAPADTVSASTVAHIRIPTAGVALTAAILGASPRVTGCVCETDSLL